MEAEGISCCSIIPFPYLTSCHNFASCLWAPQDAPVTLQTPKSNLNSWIQSYCFSCCIRVPLHMLAVLVLRDAFSPGFALVSHFLVGVLQQEDPLIWPSLARLVSFTWWTSGDVSWHLICLWSYAWILEVPWYNTGAFLTEHSTLSPLIELLFTLCWVSASTKPCHGYAILIAVMQRIKQTTSEMRQQHADLVALLLSGLAGKSHSYWTEPEMSSFTWFIIRYVDNQCPLWSIILWIISVHHGPL